MRPKIPVPPAVLITAVMITAVMIAAVVAVTLAPAALAASADVAKPTARMHASSPAYQLPSQCTGSSSQVSPAVPWAQQQLRPNRVWSLTRGAGQVVAVLDSGVSATAPALSGAVLRGSDVLTGGAGDTDCTGHGTFVAGIIAARPTPGSGFAGLAPQATILPVTVVGSGENDSVTSAALATGIRYAVNSGATIIDISTITTPGPAAALRAAVAYAAARNVVVIAPVSSGEQSEANELSYPACYPGVIAVSAVGSGDAPISAGTAGVGVDLAAPGYQVVSIGPRGRGELAGSGADLATGFVAGTAALVRSYYPRLSAAQVISRLEVTADSPGVALPDPQLGYGVVDPYTAVTTVLPQESGGLPPAVPAYRPLRLPPPPVPDTWPTTAALIVSAIAAVGIAAAVALANIVRQGRRRRWLPAAAAHQPPPTSRPSER
jgi:membrane-anchored mycosin MYCP